MRPAATGSQNDKSLYETILLAGGFRKSTNAACAAIAVAQAASVKNHKMLILRQWKIRFSARFRFYAPLINCFLHNYSLFMHFRSQTY